MLSCSHITMSISERTRSQLILKADDYGNMPEGNDGINDLVRRGLLTNVGVMITFAGEKERDDLLRAIRESPNKDLVGIVLHVNFQTGRPLSKPKDVPSLVGEDGLFKRPEPTREAWDRYAKQINPQDAERELEAQIQRFRELFGHNPDALDSHNVILAVEPVAEIAMRKAKELDIPITYPYLYTEKYDGVLGTQVLHTQLQSEYKRRGIPTADHAFPTYFNSMSDPIGEMVQALDTLQPGVTQIVFHPVSPDYPSIPTDSPERFGRRLMDYKILTDSQVETRVEGLRRNGQLTSYKEMRISRRH